jgi:hypothetical protein
MRFSGQKRWLNECEIYNYKGKYSYSQIFPEQLGTLDTHATVMKMNPRFILASFGSAVYQFFLYKKRPFDILILFGNINFKDVDQFISTFSPFAGQFWMSYYSAESSQKWNEGYHYDPFAVDEMLSYISCHPNADTAIGFDGNLILHPPRAPLPWNKRFGVYTS